MIGFLVFIYVTVCVLAIVGMWKIFQKAGQPGWAAVVPGYNLWVFCKVARCPVWQFVMLLIPYVNIVFVIIVTIKLGKAFNKSGGFICGLIFLPFVFYPILGFGDSVYDLQQTTDYQQPPVPPTSQPVPPTVNLNQD